MRKLSPKIIFLTSLGLFLASLSLKAYCLEDDCGDYWSGFVVVIFGIFSILGGGAFLTWFANPLLWLSWITIKKSPYISLICSVLSLWVALSFLSYEEILADEAGNMKKITDYALGYYLWVTSIAVVVIGQLWRTILLKNKTKTIKKPNHML